jgi:protocatechuate 3,4-dioxygenase beta subunit
MDDDSLHVVQRKGLRPGPDRGRSSAVKRACLAAAILLAVPMFAAQPMASGAMSDKPPQMRTLTGQVTNQQNAPLPEAIVYLKNTKTMAVKTYIAGRDGTYRFNALSPNVDYQVYAEHKGKKSDTKTLSSFDSRATAHINLKIKQ